MLVLTRKERQRIHIGENIVIEILGVSRGQVRVGIQAPQSVPIYREELLPFAAKPDGQRAEANDPKTEGGA